MFGVTAASTVGHDEANAHRPGRSADPVADRHRDQRRRSGRDQSGMVTSFLLRQGDVHVLWRYCYNPTGMNSFVTKVKVPG